MSSSLYASTMTAACYFGHGGAGLEIVHSFPRPTIKEGDVLVKISAASVNPIDIKLHQNNIRKSVMPLPKIPGVDFSGVVEQTYPSPSGRFNLGDRVLGMFPNPLSNQWGACAEYVAISERHIFKIPPTLSDVDAASLPMVSTIVVQALKPFIENCKGGTKDKKILIQGGAGGVGSFAIQYCSKALGMYVITTCTEGHKDFCMSLGASETLDYRSMLFEEYVSDCNVVLDPFSYLYEERTLSTKVLKRGGWYLAINSSPHSLNVFMRNKKVVSIPETRPAALFNNKWKRFCNDCAAMVGVNSHYYSTVSILPDETTLPFVISMVEEGLISPCVEKTFKLEEIAEAHRYVERGHTQGKVVIDMTTIGGK